jgi:RND family efflux transporter MFP subunit
VEKNMSELKHLKEKFLEKDSPESTQEEEILFPDDGAKERGPLGRKRKSFPIIKTVLGVALIIGVFFLGYSTRPDRMDRTMEKLQSVTSQALERVEPAKQKFDTKITELMEKKIPGRGKVAVPGVAEGKAERKIKYWQAPMNPSYISDQPGKSPMGMDLIPVYEDEGAKGDGIRISPTVLQNIGVKTDEVKSRTLTREIRTVGILAYDERKVTHIHTKYQGWIEKLYIDFTGQEVNEEDLLVEIYSPELVSTQEELLLALKYNETLKDSPFTEIGKGAERLLESTRRRLELFDVPEHQIEELIRDKKITKTLHIHSPFRGFVIKKDALQGMFVKPGMSLYTIADLSNIWVLADIYEYELPWIKIGQQVEMSLSYYPGKKFKGKVTYIDPFLDPKTRTLKVRMEFANPNWDLKPDMYANITLKSIIAKKAVAVREAAVIHSGERELVIVVTPTGGFESREVTLGAQANGFYQVIDGLKAGEKVVTSSSFLIDSESRLQEALSKLENTRERARRPVMKMKEHDSKAADSAPQ